MFSRGAKKLCRLRGEEATHEQGTFELTQSLVVCSRKLDRVLHAKWWHAPRTVWTRDKRVKALHARINEVAIELGVRFKGIMVELLQSVDPHANFDFEVARTWQRVSEDAITMNHKEFCAHLWHVFVPLRKQERAKVFKPKFMLRQFVDEIPACKDQGVLIAMAYGPLRNPRPTASEILRCLEIAYRLLHIQVSKRSSELEILTDNEISSEMISQFVAPYVQYEDWLFNCSKGENRS